MSIPTIAEMQSFVGQEMSEGPSPVGRWLRGTLRKVEEGSVTAEFTVRPEMTNPVGILHGGMIAAIMDDLIGMTVHVLNGMESFFTSINLSIDYLSSAKEGEVVTATTKIVRQGATITHAECHLYNAKGKLLAKGTTNLLRVNMR